MGGLVPVNRLSPMDGSRAAGGVMQGAAYGGGGGIDLQGPLQIDHPQHPNPGFHHHHAHQLQQQQQQQHQQQHQQFVSHQTGLSASHPQTHDMFPQSASKDVQEQPPLPPQQPHQHHHHVHHQPQQQQGFVAPDHRKIERMPSISEDDDPSLTTEGGGADVTGAEGGGKGGKKGSAGSQWHRMKWTGAMVKLLITIVSYIGEDASAADFPGVCGGGGRRKFPTLQKKGKWKSVSKVMAERGYYVSPQQCEDKFNDLNKRYKRLNDILGRGISCEVVENPVLLDGLTHVSEKGKEDVRKILSSKHLFYEEMCSYHNGNRLHLPADPEVQQLLQLALQSRDDNDAKRTSQDDSDDDDQGGSSDDDDDVMEEHRTHRDDNGGSFFSKRMKLSSGEMVEYGSAPQDGTKGLCNPGFSVDMNQVFSEAPMDEQPQRQMMASYKVQLQEQQLQIQAEMMDLERQRFKWQRFSKKKDRELEKMRLENERMKLENERLSLELKRKELELRNR